MARGTTVDQVNGGVSAITAAIVDMCFGEGVHNLHKAGVHVPRSTGGFLHIHASLGMVIADEAALHMMFMCKGSSGLKPCMLCANVFNASDERDVLKHDSTGLAVNHTCSDFGKIVQHTSATIRALIRRLDEGARTLTKGAFAELQTRLGWNFVPGALVLEPRLLNICDPVRVVLYDYMHVFFVNGVFNSNVGLLMSALKPHNITYHMMDQYIKEWTWPKQFGDAHDVMSADRARSSWENTSLKATASESLGLMPVLACFFDKVRRNSSVHEVLDHATCFLGLVRIIEDIMRTARSAVDCDALERSISAYLSAFKALYGEDQMTPKMHYIMHFADFIRRWHYLPGCFVLERKHKLPKRYANPLTNLNYDWESFVHREVTHQHVAQLEETAMFDDGAALLSPFPLSKRFTATLQKDLGVGPGVTFMTSSQARMNEWDKCSKGDVVLLHNGTVGEVVLHAAFQQDAEWTCFTSLRTWERAGEDNRCWTWRASRSPLLCLLSDIKCALIWAETGATRRTLKPLHR